MLQSFDNLSDAAGRDLTRAQWMAILARAPVASLESALGGHADRAPRWLRAPETALLMVQGRAGGTGERFNLGEVTVTRCALRLADTERAKAPVGVGYVIGRSHRHAHLAAVADALLQDPALREGLHERLLLPVRRQLDNARAERAARARTSQVEFFTVARESGRGAGEEPAREQDDVT